MRSAFVALLLVLAASTASAAQWLRHESFTFIPDGRQIRTSLPLDPSRKYHVVINSRYTLRPLLVCEERTFLGFRRPPSCWPNVELNGSIVEVSSGLHDQKWSSYFLDDRTSDYYRPRLNLYLWGTGQALQLNTTRDFTEAIPTASVEIYDIQFRASEQLLEDQRQKEVARIEEQRQQDLRRLAQQRRFEQARLEAERERERKLRHEREQERLREENLRQAAEVLRIEQEQARIREVEAEAQHQRYMQMVWAIFWLALIVVVALVVAFLGIYFRRTPVQPSRRLGATQPAMLIAAPTGESEKMRS